MNLRAALYMYIASIICSALSIESANVEEVCT